MRVMEIPSFPRPIEILNLKGLLTARLNEEVVLWPCQAIPLLGYMCHPNDETERHGVVNLLCSWPNYKGPGQPPVPTKFERIQDNWLKVASIFHIYCGMVDGKHQERRGGPSIGKAITLVAAKSKSAGTSEARLWQLWSDYKDVAHLVTTVAVIYREARGVFRERPPKLKPSQFQPFHMALLMPDLVLAVALEFERVGRTQGSDPLSKAPLDPDTHWRIPDGINVASLSPPFDELWSQDIKILNDRRAGNRGRANKTTPVSD